MQQPYRALVVGASGAIGSAFVEHMQVNAISPLLLLRSFAPLLRSGSSIYAKLSARVGSITDNTKGGWYSYRASKAALNMLLQTAALELQRKNPALRVVAMQPGTVRSKLSQPFAQTAPNLLEPHAAAAGLMQALFELKTKSGAHFVDWQGKTVSW